MRIIGICSALMVAAPLASAQMLTDTEQRAAYCIGVLKYNIQENPRVRDAVDRIHCDRWREQQFPTRDACTNAALQNELGKLRIKLARYSDYLKLQMAQRSLVDQSRDGDGFAGTVAGMALIIRKGRNDALAAATSPRTQHSGSDTESCLTVCVKPDIESCFVDCIAQHDPAAASALRCTILPDGLPY